jgi:hypothetical protein
MSPEKYELNEDTSASMMDSDKVNSLNSTLRKTGQKSSCPPEKNS